MKKLFTTLFSLFLLAGVYAQPNISLTQYVTGFSTPIDIKNCGDDRLFVVEQRGKIKIVNAQGTTLSTPFLDISNLVNQTGNERGLLGLTFHPNYANNGYFYVNYTRSSDGATTISRFSVSQGDPDVADPNSELILMTVSQPYTNHNAGDLAFGPDGYLYFGLGDGGSFDDPQNRAQNTQTLLGKMIRIDVDNGNPYSVPSSNPFVGNVAVLDEIWAIGVRNPWKFSFDRLTGDMWIGDVGQDDWEEVDFEPAGDPGGHNYGWRCYEANHAFNTSGCGAQGNYTFPVAEYANPNTGCSITGGYVYRGWRFGNLFGHYLYADYCSGRIWSTTPDGQGGWNTEEILNFTNYELASFGEDQYGELYMAGQSNGILYRLEEDSCYPVAFIKNEDTVIASGSSVTLEAIYGPGLTYQWQRDGQDIQGATAPTYVAGDAGDYTVITTNASQCEATSNIVNVDVSIGFEELIVGSVNVYPNPAEDIVNVSFENISNTNARLTLYNAMGQMVVTSQQAIGGGKNLLTLNTSGLAPGFYTLDIEVGSDRLSRKVVVSR